MSRPALEVADIFRDHGAAWRSANAGDVSLGQLKAMSAIERCRTAALGGHVARCEDCAQITVAFNSCLMGKICNGELAVATRPNSSILGQSGTELATFLSPLRCVELDITSSAAVI